MFYFKQFTVDQIGCAMKINTDGVLLGAMSVADEPKCVLDIGTGTGVIALMLVQKYKLAKVDAVEIDEVAAQTASRNFTASPFAERMTLYTGDFEKFFNLYPSKQYDLIVSNPPFYIDSLKSPAEKKSLAKHSDESFFERLLNTVRLQLTLRGCFWIIIPLALKDLIDRLVNDYGFFINELIYVKSYLHSPVHRIIINMSFSKFVIKESHFTIYQEQGVYSKEYESVLQPYFLAF